MAEVCRSRVSAADRDLIGRTRRLRLSHRNNSADVIDGVSRGELLNDCIIDEDDHHRGSLARVEDRVTAPLECEVEVTRLADSRREQQEGRRGGK